MNLAVVTNEEKCPRTEIAVYLDGELTSADELYLEQHFAVCDTCLNELNSQKKLLSALDFAFENKHEEIELPENFTKIVVAKAESGVIGLRSKKERLWAMIICSILLLLPLAGLGTDVSQVFETFTNLGKQILILAGFINRLFFDVAVGFAIILRTLSHQVVSSSGFILILFFGVTVFGIFSFSRMFLKFNRS